MKSEYKVVSVSGTDVVLEKALAEFGRYGWELVAIQSLSSYSSDNIRFYLKRAI